MYRPVRYQPSNGRTELCCAKQLDVKNAERNHSAQRDTQSTEAEKEAKDWRALYSLCELCASVCTVVSEFDRIGIHISKSIASRSNSATLQACAKHPSGSCGGSVP